MKDLLIPQKEVKDIEELVVVLSSLSKEDRDILMDYACALRKGTRMEGMEHAIL